MKKSVYAMLTATVVVICSGCQNTVNTVENEQKSFKRNYVKSKNISTDGYLRSRLLIDNISKTTLPSGLTQAQVTLRSNRVGFFSEMWSHITGENPYKVSYRFNWMDDNGMEVQTASSVWKELDLIPGETKRIQSIGPTPRCKDFVVSIKEYDYKVK